jgi:integrase
VARNRRRFGNVRRLPSRHWQARYTGPDGATHKAPFTFDTKGDAETWLAMRQSEIVREVWSTPNEPKASPVSFAEYASAWLSHRPDLKPRTQAHYWHLLDRYLIPAFGEYALPLIDAGSVRSWFAAFTAGPTIRAHAYSLLKSILGTAVSDDLIPANPCRIRGGGQSKRVRKIRPATLEELDALVAALPDRYRAIVLIAAWCGLRYGELAELRRGDLDVTTGVIHVRRAVISTRATGTVIGTPKSDAGVRDVTIPPHLLPMVKGHLQRYVGPGKNALLFPARSDGNMTESALYKVYMPAREAAGRPDLRFHDLRHTGATMAAATGASLAELMARLGHSTPGAAMRYQHAAQDRDRVIAELLSEHANGTVSPIKRRKEAGAK